MGNQKSKPAPQKPADAKPLAELSVFVIMRGGSSEVATSMRGHEVNVLNCYTTLLTHYPQIVALGGLAFGHKLATVVYFDLGHDNECCEVHDIGGESNNQERSLAIETCASCQRLMRPPLSGRFQGSRLAPFHLGVTGWVRAALGIDPQESHPVARGRLLLPSPADIWCPGRPSEVAEFLHFIFHNEALGELRANLLL